MESALSNIDILSCICDEIDRNATLLNASLVCTKWSFVALRVLWKRKGSFVHLAKALKAGSEASINAVSTQSANRRWQEYASQIQSVYWHAKGYDGNTSLSVADYMRPLLFPGQTCHSYSSLTLAPSARDGLDDRIIARALAHQNLHALTIHALDGQLKDLGEFFLSIADNVPQLKNLRMVGIALLLDEVNRISKELVVKLPALEKFEILTSGRKLPLLTHIGELQHLKHVSLGLAHRQHQQLEDLPTSDTRHLFPALCSLSLECLYHELVQLLQNYCFNKCDLRGLRLVSRNPPGSWPMPSTCFHSLTSLISANFGQLTYLELDCRTEFDGRIGLTDLEPLSKCKHIQEFRASESLADLIACRALDIINWWPDLLELHLGATRDSQGCNVSKPPKGTVELSMLSSIADVRPHMVAISMSFELTKLVKEDNWRYLFTDLKKLDLLTSPLDSSLAPNYAVYLSSLLPEACAIHHTAMPHINGRHESYLQLKRMVDLCRTARRHERRRLRMTGHALTP